ncbi:MAG: hypothetical protein IJI22_05435 [Bacilli bacterium]|nr:hypothetical protein [Bacilli bacterium]
MKKNELKKIISQIKKYSLEKAFDTPKDFDEWLNGLNAKQINNFNSLMVDPNEIQFPLYFLIDENLLNCDDYPDRINAMSKLKNADGWYHLFDRLCSPNFLNSKNYYEDMEMISKAPSAQHPLWIVNKDAFINSPYHKEDLKLIIEGKDTPKENGNELDWLVKEALTVVAGNADSINSPYHQNDMQLIAHSGSECLQMSHSYPESSLNNLATNSVSLKDKYHLENMQILAQKPNAAEYLYELMTNPEIIKGKYYRNEVNALVTSKSSITAMAMYFYILNPDEFESRRMSNDYLDQLWDLGLDFKDTMEIRRKNSIKGSTNPNYLQYLALLNQIDDKYVLFVESLLSNKAFASSQYCDYDLNVLLSIQDKDIFLDLYRFMSYEISLNGSHHIKDLDIISKTDNKELRKWLISKAINENSINSCYHDYDMEYISKLDLDNTDREILKSMHYYLFVPNGINHPNHIERLEKLSRGETIQSEDTILSHLDYLENNPDNVAVSAEENPKVLSRIRQMFRGK